MLFPSPRYGAEAIAKLINQVDGNILLTPSPPLPVTAEVLQKRPMRTCQIPSLEDLISTETKPYPFTKTFAEHKHEPFLSLHTSGTTGFPKPILWTHDWANSYKQSLALPPSSDGIPLATHFYGSNVRILFPFPPFHASGAIGQTFFGPCSGTTIVLPPPALTPDSSVNIIADTLDFLGDAEGAKVDIVALPPPHMEYLASQPAILERVSKRVKMAMFGGGDLGVEVGNIIAQKMQLNTDVGSTELGLWPSLARSETSMWNGEKVDEYWHYLPLHPALNIRLDFVSSSPQGDIGEAIMVRNDEDGWVQPLFKIYTNDKERSLGDLFIRHPRHPELWKHHGRVDDLLNFITTEKFHPGVAEQRIGAHPAVEEIMMVGTRRPKSALIVRLLEGSKVDDIWKVIEEVNETSPVYAKVDRDMILIVKEPFLKTAKGSIQKKAMLELYDKQLDGLYNNTA
jgi:acyl-coenzyme A synthetase/AMP-(fatty) acid ligase